MNRGNTFRSRFDMRMHRLHDTADEFESTVKEQASAIAEHTREGILRGQKAVTAWEKRLEASLQGNPMLYFGAALAVIGLLIAKILLDRRQH